MRQPPRPPAAVVFDLDNTLCDWSAGIDRFLQGFADQRVAERFRSLVAEHARLRREGTVIGWRHWMTRRDPEWFWTRAAPGASSDEIARFVEEYTKRLELPLFDDVISALSALAGRVRLALLSNGPHAVDRARNVGILDHFEVAHVAPRNRMKPHPDAFAAVLEALGLGHDAVVYVGDDLEEDVEGALASGISAVWLDRVGSGWPPPPGASRITSLDELPGLLGL